MVHYELFPPRQTVNKEYFLSVVRRLREAIRLNIPELWANNSWVLHRDNALSDSFFVTISSKIPRTSFRNRRIRLIWLRVTSGYSRNSSDHSGVSSRLTR